MSRLSLVTYFTLFSVVPGLGYQWVQDEARPKGIDDPTLGYLAGVAPNFLGGMSMTAALVVIWGEWRRHVPPARRHREAAATALSLLLAWEVVQGAWGRMTFDWNDMAWTFPGVGLAWLAAFANLKSIRKNR